MTETSLNYLKAIKISDYNCITVISHICHALLDSMSNISKKKHPETCLSNEHTGNPLTTKY